MRVLWSQAPRWALRPLLLTSARGDRALGGAQIAAGLFERRARGVGLAAFEQQERELDAALRLAQRLADPVAAVSGQLRQDRFAAPHQLFVRRLDIDHQP